MAPDRSANIFSSKVSGSSIHVIKISRFVKTMGAIKQAASKISLIVSKLTNSSRSKIKIKDSPGVINNNKSKKPKMKILFFIFSSSDKNPILYRYNFKNNGSQIKQFNSTPPPAAGQIEKSGSTRASRLLVRIISGYLKPHLAPCLRPSPV